MREKTLVLEVTADFLSSSTVCPRKNLMIQKSEFANAHIMKWRSSSVPWWFEKTYPFWIPALKKNTWLAWYRAILHSDSDAVARCEANTQTGTLAEGFFVLDETTAGKGSGLSNRQLDKGCKAKAGSSRPRANSIARAHRIRSASGKQPRRNVQAEKSTLDDAVCSHYDSYIGTCFVFLTFLRCILFCFLPAQRWEA